jgi:hypothetical protein
MAYIRGNVHVGVRFVGDVDAVTILPNQPRITRTVAEEASAWGVEASRHQSEADAYNERGESPLEVPLVCRGIGGDECVPNHPFAIEYRDRVATGSSEIPLEAKTCVVVDAIQEKRHGRATRHRGAEDRLDCGAMSAPVGDMQLHRSCHALNLLAVKPEPSSL